MYIKVILLFILVFSFPVSAKEKNADITEFNIVTSVSCGMAKDLSKVFIVKDLIFTGLINTSSIVKIYLTEDKAFAIIMENSIGMSCLYFTGIPGILIDKKNKTKE
jgi:hypothetical protein|tara:strand:+ start:977 stop:1294 length:318 start_codon:yes stop_codon:yes gene_type:complete